MFSLGIKKTKPKNIGHKSYELVNMGHKIIDKVSKLSNLKSTSNGLIENYSNHPNNLYEPIKGVEIKTKSKFTVEKPKNHKSHNQSYD